MKHAIVVALTVCTFVVSGCKNKGDAVPAAGSSGSAATGSAPAPATGSAPAPAPATGSAPAGSAAAANGVVDTNDKAEHYADGRVCCVFNTADSSDATHEIMTVGNCMNMMDSKYARLNQCGDIKAVTATWNCKKLCKLATDCKLDASVGAPACEGDCDVVAHGETRAAMRGAIFYKCMDTAADCAAAKKCSP